MPIHIADLPLAQMAGNPPAIAPRVASPTLRRPLDPQALDYQAAAADPSRLLPAEPVASTLTMPASSGAREREAAVGFNTNRHSEALANADQRNQTLSAATAEPQAAQVELAMGRVQNATSVDPRSFLASAVNAEMPPSCRAAACRVATRIKDGTSVLHSNRAPLP